MKSNYFLFLPIFGLLLTGFSYHGTGPISYKVDPKQSKIQWTGYYLFNFGEHHGSIELLKGEFHLDGQNITGGYFNVDMKSIKNLDMPEEEGGKDLATHLMSNDFFDTDKFPTAQFEITKIEKIEDALPKNPNYNITGDLVVKGIKNSLTFPALISFTENGIRAKAKFKVDRTKWGIHYNSGKFFADIGDGAISDAIGIEMDLVAPK